LSQCPEDQKGQNEKEYCIMCFHYCQSIRGDPLEKNIKGQHNPKARVIPNLKFDPRLLLRREIFPTHQISLKEVTISFEGMLAKSITSMGSHTPPQHENYLMKERGRKCITINHWVILRDQW